ncbi:hypothetical protein QI633_03315 [Nocardioides sp. QY071]|uniref:hypothetical protein n=1 Tax=Nocardioides sp. QY071 TaxID=3044187 RepID=UPI00249C4005|nr:hypothetical protein [Nocardioides sp. QY071]WGY02792.1 hypothetical protein QI633_03315 [Nocardioides sp. QY071]
MADDRTDPRDALRSDERAREHAEFRSLLIPNREVPLVEEADEDHAEDHAEDDVEDHAEDQAFAADLPDDEHEALRRVVVTEHAIPRFEPLEGAGQVPGLGEEIVRRRRSSRRRSHHHTHRTRRPEPAPEPAPEAAPNPAPKSAPKAAPETPSPTAGTGRRETFILVAVLAVLIALAAIYAAAQKADQPSDSGLRQGASRVSSQPLDVRA